jgi:REP element-mobilizing transposase RayT
MILPAIEDELYEYLTHQCNQAGCMALQVGGHQDHVHILCRLSKHTSIPKLLEKIKGTSSKWIKTRFHELSDFYWQDGYGAFSVSARDLDRIIAYIRNQHVHHRSKSFKEEYFKILDLNNVEYDQRYLWD